jgi:hypothetical protein
MLLPKDSKNHLYAEVENIRITYIPDLVEEFSFWHLLPN